MPGLVLFRRRWAIGSDDMVVPGALLLFYHLVLACLFIAISVVARHSAWQSASDNATVIVLPTGVNNRSLTMDGCRFSMQVYSLIYLAIICLCLIVEALIVRYSLLGSVLYMADARQPIVNLLYCRLVLLLLELTWLGCGIAQLCKLNQSSPECSNSLWPVRAVTVIVSINCSAMLLMLLSVWCAFDQSGRVWLRLRPAKPAAAAAATANSLHIVDSTDHTAVAMRRISSFARRNSWKQRDALVQYEHIWDQRFRRLFCCLNGDDRNAQATFRDIARLFSEFFRDLDVVPSDVLAGLVLLRRYQKERARMALKSRSADIQAFMSGRPVLPSTRFLYADSQAAADLLPELVFGMKLALAAYGCPMLAYTTNCCCLLCHLRSCAKGGSPIIGGRCCCSTFCRGDRGATARASVEALLRRSGIGPDDFQLLHVSQELLEAADCNPFYIGLDKRRGRLVLAIRGTLSLQDVLTDLRADAEQIWPEAESDANLSARCRDSSTKGSKAVNFALESVSVHPRPGSAHSKAKPASGACSGHSGIVRAAERVHQLLLSSGWLAESLPLLITGHSLGAGIAVVLGLRLRSSHVTDAPNVLAFSPPGGLLCSAGAEAASGFVTSVVIGKDAVCRLGLAQLEGMRAAMTSLLNRARKPKWRIICCNGDGGQPIEEEEMTDSFLRQDWHAAAGAGNDRPPLYLPGKILHLVRSARPSKAAPVLWQAVWADRADFDELLVSPSMLRDHLPDCVLEALEQMAEQVRAGDRLVQIDV